MASSDDEDEGVPHVVSNYHFVNDKDEPISFSELPVVWNGGEGLDDKRKQVFLHGTTDNGLQKIYKQVTAWKFDLSDANPEILMLSKENNWIKLQKPRKSFEDTIRTILISVHCLHFAKKNLEISERSLWDHLSKVFSFYETRPSENDLIDQISLISEAVEKDKTLAKSKFLVTFLEGKHEKKDFDKDNGTITKPGFIVDDDMIDGIEEDGGSDEEDDLFDSVCAICDNGGDILCCEGRCMRSFHATEEAGSESACDSLGLSNEQVEAVQNFFCKNCQYKKHQCFACGELGSSDKLSGAEVFPCVSATCGHFYHPHCVAKLLHRESAAEAEELRKKIAAGESFTCPIHKCVICKQGENKMDPDWQFAVCRRCPKSYHRKCLPKKIAFEDMEDEGLVQRAWEDLIPNRILIYCLKHEIDDELGTPIRNHIKFPDDGQKKKKQASEQISRKEKVLQKEITLASTDASRKRTLVKFQKGLDFASRNAEDGSKISVRRLTGPDSSKKQKVGDTSRKPLNNTASAKGGKFTDENKLSLGERLYNLISKGPEPVKSRKDTPDSEHKQTLTEKPVAKEKSNLLPLDDDSKRRIMALVKDATSSITQENIIKMHKLPTTHSYSSRNVVDRSFTLGKVEGSCEAIRAALKKLEDGCSFQDAKLVCDTKILDQIIKWKNKLKVYLAPFLYGMRYTSFGRHFTKVDKLKEIVDVLHCYVQDGDMVVDFCCGSNDFSCLMKKKLDETGVRCSYKNYDILQAKNDFNFEKRDWMSVQPKELPTGSQLIMGLNPPFGVNAGLANKFIDKALEFKPKLLIIIAPRETERLDEKDPPYDLVWEDDELLSGRSFYLPGSVDINDNQLDDWNVKTSLLYLWSRPDWTAKHKVIAQQHGHFGRVQERLNLEEEHHETLVSDHPVEVCDLSGQTSTPMDDHPVQNETHEPVQERGASVAESHKEGFPVGNGNKEIRENSSHGKNHSNKHSKKRLIGKGKHGRRGPGETSPEFKERGRSGPVETSPEFKEGGPSSVSGMHDKIPLHSLPPYVTHGRSLEPLEVQPPSHMEVDEEGHHRRFEANIAGRRTDYQSRYVENRGDDIAMRYGFNSEEPYSGVNHRWSSGTSPGPGLSPDYGVRNPDEQFAGYRRDSTEIRGYRSQVGEIEPNYITESSAFRSQAHLFGHPHPDTLGQRSSYLAGGDPGFSSPYSRMGPTMDPYDRMNTSAMQRYAPRLDELNHTRMNSLGSLGSVPPPAGRNGIPDPFAPQPGYRVDSMGFAPGPRRPFPQQNPSSGWIND